VGTTDISIGGHHTSPGHGCFVTFLLGKHLMNGNNATVKNINDFVFTTDNIESDKNQPPFK
jgi:hypothetical protein